MMRRTASKSAPKARAVRQPASNADVASAAKKMRTSPSTLDYQLIWDFANIAARGSPDDQPSRNATTYSQIKRMILIGELGSGNKLVHEDLADRLQVSRTPVREALERLYQEGFVTRLPRRGFYVAGITRDEAFDLYGTREALELHALQMTLERGPVAKSSIERLWHYVRQYEELAKSQVLTQRLVADVLFHLNLAELSGNRFLVRQLAQVFELLGLKRWHEGYHHSRTQLANAEHMQLMAALTAYDKRAATQTLRKHILSARDALLSQLYDAPSILGPARPKAEFPPHRA
jgi:DNA-binding GntR family transcriptional regulator